MEESQQSECLLTVTVSSIDNSLCVDRTASVTFQICLNCPGKTGTYTGSAALATSTSPTGLTITPASGVQSYTLSDMQCTQVTFDLQATQNFLDENNGIGLLFGANLNVDGTIVRSGSLSPFIPIGIPPDLADFETEADEENCRVQFTSLGDEELINTHSWDFGDGSSGGAAANPIHTFPNPGPWTVIHTVSNLCGSLVDTQEVFLGTLELDINIIRDTLCAGELVRLSSNAPEGTQLLWDFGDGVTTTVPEPVYYFPAGTQTISLQALGENCEGGFASETITVTNSSGTQYDYVINGTPAPAKLSDVISQNSWPRGALSNASIFVIGTFELDQDYAFGPDCAFDFAPGAHLIVGEQDTFNFVTVSMRSNTFKGCGLMWRGISVEFGCNIIFSNNSISDAQYALEMGGESTLTLTSNTFDRNYVGLTKLPVSSFQTLGPVESNTFTCTDDLFLPFPGQSPAPGQLGWAGIYLPNQRSFSLDGDPNIFRLLRNGIVVENTNLIVMNTSFSNHQPGDYALSGFGIHATSENNAGSLTFTGSGSSVDFGNCMDGIFVQGQPVEVRKADMDEMGNGITVQNGQTSIQLIDNDIQLSAPVRSTNFFNPIPYYGIEVSQPDLAAKTVVDNNSFSLEGPGCRGIFMNGFNRFGLVTEVTNNFVTSNSGWANYGISLNSVVTTWVSQNDVDVSQAQLGFNFGYDVRNSALLELECNSLTGATQGEFGLFVDMAPFNAYRCNTLEDAGSAAFFQGSSIMSDLQGNDFLGNTDDLRLNEAIIGIQDHAENTWDMPSRAVYSGDPADAFRSQFRVPMLSPPDAPSTIVGPPDWFVSGIAPPSPFDCVAAGCDTFGEISEPELDSTEIRIAQDALDSLPANTLEWTSRRQLYSRLADRPELILPGVVQQFVDTFETRVIGELDAAAQDIQSLYSLSTADSTTAAGYAQELNDWLDSLQTIDSLQLAGPGELDSLALIETRRDLQDSLIQLSTEIDSFWQIVYSGRATQAALVLTDVNAINPGNVWETNERTVQRAYLQGLSTGQLELGSTQLSSLEEVAGQCPAEGGPAVYQARALLEYTGNFYYRDSVLCGFISQAALRQEPEPLIDRAYWPAPADQQIRLYPNPASGQVFLQLPAELQARAEPLHIQLFDGTGRLVRSWSLRAAGRLQPLSIAGLAKGMYWLRLQHSPQPVKLIIH